ncbi:MAG: RDD family protein [Acidobacteria bacterium]|nr:RDD family protein [Acidobacteriota bacterium]
MTDNSNVTTRTSQTQNNSTLIEFPGVNRPAWRRELSERFREIQQKRALESKSAPPAEEQPQTTLDDARASAKSRAAESASKQLGLVPPPDAPELNPLVAAALKRIERARANASAARPTSGRGQAAAAAARVVEEQPVQEATEPVLPPPPPLVVVQPKPAPRQPEPTPKAEPAVPETLVEEVLAPAAAVAETPASRAVATREVETVAKSEAVSEAVSEVAQVEMQPSASAEAETSPSSKQPRHLSGVLDEFWLERQGIELLPKVEEKELTYDDRAPRYKRLTAAFVDLFAVVLLCAPFAAAIELSNGNWQDPRVSGSMALIAALLMFLYHTCSVALAGRTPGMRFLALHAVDARKASVPTTGQCMRRALFYMLSLATGGLGILYSLFDAEGRTVHDILSGTVVVRK